MVSTRYAYEHRDMKCIGGRDNDGAGVGEGTKPSVAESSSAEGRMTNAGGMAPATTEEKAARPEDDVVPVSVTTTAPELSPTRSEEVIAVDEMRRTSPPTAIVAQFTMPTHKTHANGIVVSNMDDEDGVAAARARRKLERKQAKRRRVACVKAKRRQESEAAVSEHNRVAEERREARRLQADAALTQLAERRLRRSATPKTKSEGTARVSLVQRRRHASSTEQEEVEDVEYAEANDGLPTATVEVNGARRQIKLDSCARYTVAGTEWMKHGDKVECEAPVDFVEGIGGFLLDVVGVWRFSMRSVFGELIELDACIVDGCVDEFLLGVDFMKAHGAVMDFDKSEVRYYEAGRAVVLPFETYEDDGGARVAAVRLVQKTQLAASVVMPIEVVVPAADGEQGIFLPTKYTGSVMLAATVTKAKGGRAWVPAINSNSTMTKLPNKKELGVWIPLDDDMTILAMSGELHIDRVREWVDQLGDSHTPLQNENEVHVGNEDESANELILKLLRVYRKLSENNGDCPPATALDIYHHIDTGDAAPMMLKRRRQAQSEDKIVNANVEQMLGAGVIEEGQGAWGFPVVLVKKKDGEIRFCVDYRALNKVTKKDVYPLPRIDETLEALGGALWFSTLDLKAGYWQILVAPDDRDKTVFTTKNCLYRFVRMPFGLTNAPSTFQRMMNHVLRGLTWTTCLLYLDDIVVFTRGGLEMHVVELASVLERLAMAGLPLKLKKCRFAMKSMEYLGHELSNEGVRPLQRLVTAVQEFPRPTDASEVKRFVHLAGYYRRFVEGFGSIMAPMTKLLRSKEEWQWTEAQEVAFERIKVILTTRPLLIYPDFKLPFRVVTDASQIGLGACLMQDRGSGWQPVAYASKVNSETESKYGITELECMAVVG
ncbi:hypothetical protein PF004_g11636 [Phytophthora fragariae]|uniref:Reverse transcriptase domain-containing protein n=1 Tax=Phytophthora fragariae TaxID=53985 RepID=A0A6G0NXK7_9STRA|nr:hypothetical protein PF004_g11636 [Phytophthora fragariae]